VAAAPYRSNREQPCQRQNVGTGDGVRALILQLRLDLVDDFKTSQ